MSTESKTPTSQQPTPDMSAAADSRRNQVMVGDLPADFLRAGGGAGGGGPRQEQEDHRIAQVLQAQQQAGFVQPVAANLQGRLSITIVQARLNRNYGLVKMDPYCRVRVGHTVFETPTSVNGGKNPHWNKTVQTYLPHGVDSMYLEIFDERSFTVDDRVAWAVIPIPQTVISGETVDQWTDLSGRLGDGLEGAMNVILSLAPATTTLPQVSYVSTFPAPMVMPMYFPAPVVCPPAPQPMVYQQQPGVPPMQQQQPPQPQPPPQMTEDDLKQVKDMFPNMEDEVIKSVFEANRGNKDATINSLLSMASE
ncbi:toll-interacting protein A-like [Babylonia areolata]|uniref:toll-interacting protein A-like n=1 Tax=Babylonia areolata TaxID=304850 RepID=UPI003FD2AA33